MSQVMSEYDFNFFKKLCFIRHKFDCKKVKIKEKLSNYANIPTIYINPFYSLK